MSMDYVRRTYSVPAKRGGRIRFEGKPGRITSAYGGDLRILLDGEKHSVPVHPTWEMEYEDAKAERKPRVWRHGDPEPTGHVRIRDNQGDVWRRSSTNPDMWETPETKPFPWAHVLKKWGPVTEVIEPDAGPETENRRSYVVVRGEYRPVEDVHLPEDGSDG